MRDTGYQDYIAGYISQTDPELAAIIRREDDRQRRCLQLIASENVCSDRVLAATGCAFNRKYAEGYAPAREMGMKGRYYGGCEHFNELEELTIARFRKVFAPDYWCNVQPHSGTHANQIAYASVLEPGDRVVAMDLAAGAHISHFSRASYTSHIYDARYYGLTEDGYIDMDQFEDVVRTHRPKLVVAGASSYSREIDFQAMGEIAHRCGAYFMADIAHISTLCAFGQHQSPFHGAADLVTTTCQKIMRSTRGGVVFCVPELAKKLDQANFPRMSGGSLGHVIAGKCVGIGEVMRPEYAVYVQQVADNAKTLADELMKQGLPLVTGGTDNHLMVIDLRTLGVNGQELQDALDSVNISTSKQGVPNDPLPPSKGSGLRLGTPAQTTLGSTPEDFREMARIIADAVHTLAAGTFDQHAEEYRQRVSALVARYD